MLLIAYVLIISSAFVHASWNVCTRHLKGNTSLVVLAHIGGTIIFSPYALYNYQEFPLLLQGYRPLLVLLSAIAHSTYILFLAAAYKYGDVGLVYPLARGTAIMLSAIFAQVLGIDPTFDTMEIIGVVTVLVGILGLSLNAIIYQQVSLVISNSNNEIKSSDVRYKPVSTEDNEIEMTAMESQSSNLDSPSKASQQVQQPTTSDSSKSRSKLLLSIGLALCVGVCTGSYSLLDAVGVRAVEPLVYNTTYSTIANMIILLPIIYIFRHDEAIMTLTEHTRYVFVMSPLTVGAYVIILYVFTLPGTNVALTVTLREFSVLIGSVVGVIFLGESCGVLKMIFICCILVGMILIKLGS